MKILYVSWMNSGEGSQIHAKEFIHGMETLGHTIIPVELSLRSKEQIQKQHTGPTPPSSRFLDFKREIKSLLLNGPRLLRLRRLIKEHNPDFIINRYSIYDISPLLAKWIYKTPVMIEVNASAVFERELVGKYYFKGISTFLEKLLFSKADSLSVVSNELLHYFSQHGYDTTNVVVTPNGVDITKFELDTPPPHSLSKLTTSWSANTVIGFMGSFQPWHGMERLVELMPELLKENPAIRLLIVGDGKTRSKVEEKISELGVKDQVYITGFLDYKDIPGALNIMDIAIAPYHHIEHFHFSPLKIFEYMAIGKPVIAPNLGQCRDLIQNNETGILLKENTNEELKNAILYLTQNEDQRKLFGINARSFISEHYTWVRNAERYIDAMKVKL
ncbi:glycosyltransferase family 4 protein [Bacillus coahuilensis]|uniref:glycosyltransferase family 4 protein n=1 Tax=Bacillus coahuilensis TaxID=408580 RepID=UPI0001851253|nr:glycosyltransferase family 4 protein [Bacillus coahuilensis]